MRTLTEKDKQRYWSKVDVRGLDECWPWIGLITRKGYGFFSVGGARGERGGNHVLTEEQVRSIRREYVPGQIRMKDIAIRYGVGWKAIQKIIQRTRWGHLT